MIKFPSLSVEDLDHVLAHTQNYWEELRGQRLFITGGTGFFGMWLVETFLWANQKLNLGADAFVLMRDPIEFIRKRPHLAGQTALVYVKGDVTSFKFPEQHFSHIIHAAAPAGLGSTAMTPLSIFDNIATGARHVLNFAQHCGAKKLLFTSSGAVYKHIALNSNNMSENAYSEPSTMDMASAYGESKRLAEILCITYAQNNKLEVKIARCFAFVGPYLPLDKHFAIGNFIRDVLQDSPIYIVGDGTPLRSYLYAADLAIWLWTILFRGTSCRPYNTGSGAAISIANTANTVAATLAPGTPIHIAQPVFPNQAQHIYVPDIRRAQEELGLTVTVDLPEALRRTAQWYRSNAIV